MNILGIETSCDETSAAVVKNGRVILSNIIASSLKQHQKYGGIIPEIASRHQLQLINAVVEKAMADAGVPLTQLDAIAVTGHPGLIGSLLVGLSFARALSYALHKPLIEVDHIEAHLYANFLVPKEALVNGLKPKYPRLPAVGLIVSGGHTSLYYISDFKKFELLGQTRDDAAGEAFDKVARILNLGFPGGPIIDRLARRGENKEIHFPYAEMPDNFDFSFSGVKTSVLYFKEKNSHKKNFSLEKTAYAFQDSVVSVLIKKSIDACLKRRVKTLLVGGGVAANSALRTRLMKKTRNLQFDVFFPPMSLCIDNAAMIAGLGFHHLKQNRTASVSS